jgi:hypothetical protein
MELFGPGLNSLYKVALRSTLYKSNNRFSIEFFRPKVSWS